MIESVDPAAQFAEAKKAVDEARAALVARLDEISAEKKTAHAKWSAEESKIHELLRVKAKYTRKPKPVEKASNAA